MIIASWLLVQHFCHFLTESREELDESALWLGLTQLQSRNRFGLASVESVKWMSDSPF